MPDTRGGERRDRKTAQSAGAGSEAWSDVEHARRLARHGLPAFGFHTLAPSTTATPSKAKTHAPSLKPHSASPHSASPVTSHAPAAPTLKPSKRPTSKKTSRPTTTSPSAWPTVYPITPSPVATDSPTSFDHCMTDGGPALQSSRCVFPFKLVGNGHVFKFSTCAPSAFLPSINVSVSDQSSSWSQPIYEAHTAAFCSTISVLTSKPEVANAWGFCNCPPTIPAPSPSKSPLVLATIHPSTWTTGAPQSTLTPVTASPSSSQSPTIAVTQSLPRESVPHEQGSLANPACSAMCYSLVGAGVAVLILALAAFLWFKPRLCVSKSLVAARYGRDSPAASVSNLTGLQGLYAGRVSPRPQDFEVESKFRTKYEPEAGDKLAEA